MKPSTSQTSNAVTITLAEQKGSLTITASPTSVTTDQNKVELTLINKTANPHKLNAKDTNYQTFFEDLTGPAGKQLKQPLQQITSGTTVTVATDSQSNPVSTEFQVKVSK